MFCPNCGKQIPDDSAFCEFCGCSIAQYKTDGAAPGGPAPGGGAMPGAGANNAGNGMGANGQRQVNYSGNGMNGNGQAGGSGSPGNGKTNPVLIVALVLVVALLIGGVFLVRTKTIKFGKFKVNPEVASENKDADGAKDSKEDKEAEKEKEDSSEAKTEEKAGDKAEGAVDGKADAATTADNATDVENSLTGSADGAKTDAEGTASQAGAEGGDVTDSEYNPATYAISGGTWDILQSGESVYTMKDGTSVQNAWIDDGGKYKYVDFTGCLMKNNYTADGFWVGDDGTWDQSVKQRKDDVEPVSGASYGTDPVVVIDILNFSDNASYAKATRTYSFGYTEEFNVMPLGNSTYLLEGKDDFNSGFLMSVSEDKKTLTVSGLGTTEVYQMK